MDKKFEIGNKIREIRIKKNISVFELAYRTKTSQSHIYQIEGGAQNMSIELLFKIADTLETDPNTILGVKNTVASVDEALNELPFEMKSKLSVLFGAMINQIKEQETTHETNRRYALIIVRQFISYLNRFFLFISQRTFRCRPGGLLYAVKLSFIAIMYKIDYILFAIYGKISILSI